MNILLPIVYFTFFALIAGTAFAMMWANIQAINAEMNKPKSIRHPEAPKEGEEVMHTDLISYKIHYANKERLENLYNQKENES